MAYSDENVLVRTFRYRMVSFRSLEHHSIATLGTSLPKPHSTTLSHPQTSTSVRRLFNAILDMILLYSAIRLHTSDSRVRWHRWKRLVDGYQVADEQSLGWCAEQLGQECAHVVVGCCSRRGTLVSPVPPPFVY
jgi:hypothetical protein